MTDDGDTVFNIAQYMAPASEHVLDWFHIIMRITVMQQYIKGVAYHNVGEAEVLSRQIKAFSVERNLHDGQIVVDDLLADLEDIETRYEGIKALRKAATEFQTCISDCAWMLPNYAERRRYGERVSTGFVESTVYTVVGKRFCRHQQMRWSERSAHNMLQSRTRTLDGTLGKKFEQWYPGMNEGSEIALVA